MCFKWFLVIFCKWCNASIWKEELCKLLQWQQLKVVKGKALPGYILAQFEVWSDLHTCISASHYWYSHSCSRPALHHQPSIPAPSLHKGWHSTFQCSSCICLCVPKGETLYVCMCQAEWGDCGSLRLPKPFPLHGSTHVLNQHLGNSVHINCSTVSEQRRGVR